MLPRFIKEPEVIIATGLSKSTIYRLECQGKFPNRRKLTGADGFAVGWLENEVRDWIETRPICEHAA